MLYQVDYKLSHSDEELHSRVIDADSKSEAKRLFIEGNYQHCEIVSVDLI